MERDVAMEVLLFTPKRFVDNRGWFSEIYNANRELGLGISDAFVQDNQSCSSRRGTVRGIHFQLPPRGQAKLVRCTRGRVIDFVVDLRKDSPTYANHISVELTAENGRQLYIPVGFGHAFATLDDETEIIYKVSDFYSAEHDAGILWDCPDIAISWPVSPVDATVSEKDKMLPSLKDFESPFEYDGSPLRLRTID